MPRNPALPDAIGILGRHRENIRQLRNRERAHTEARTFLVGGDIAAGLIIPEAQIALDVGRDIAMTALRDDISVGEARQLIGFYGHLQTGSVTVDWYLNGLAVATGHVLDTTPNANNVILTTPVDLANGDILKPVVTGAGTGTDMSASFVTVVWPL